VDKDPKIPEDDWKKDWKAGTYDYLAPGYVPGTHEIEGRSHLASAKSAGGRCGRYHCPRSGTRRGRRVIKGIRVPRSLDLWSIGSRTIANISFETLDRIIVDQAFVVVPAWHGTRMQD
jgi:hypothetical protein